MGDCFGKLYDPDALECQPENCDAWKECKETMLKIEDRKLPCFGKPAPEGYEPGNPACENVCKRRDACIEAQKAATAVKPSAAIPDTSTEYDLKVDARVYAKEPRASRDVVGTAKEEPVVEEKVTEITEPVVEEKVTEITEPVVEEKVTEITEPVVEEKVTEITEPVIEEKVTEITEPVVEEKVTEPDTGQSQLGKPTKKATVREAIAYLKKFTKEDLVQVLIDKGLIEDTEADRSKNRALIGQWLSEFKRTKEFPLTKIPNSDYFTIL